jgi:hypothetical protein
MTTSLFLNSRGAWRHYPWVALLAACLMWTAVPGALAAPLPGGTGAVAQIDGVNNAAGSMWAMFTGPLLGVMGLIVLIGALVGGASSGTGNRGGGAIAGGVAGLALAALVSYMPAIVTTMYTAAGAQGAPLSGLLPQMMTAPMNLLDPGTVAVLTGVWAWTRRK